MKCKHDEDQDQGPRLRPLLDSPVAEAAQALVGSCLRRDRVLLRITEVEAYAGPEDSASHARHGRTPRNAAMWGPPGRAYLYFCYGMHWMLNVVTGPEGIPSAVLIRSAEVVEGLDVVLERRKAASSHLLCAGPGKVAQALGLDRSFDGHDLSAPGGLEWLPRTADIELLAGPRVGIGFATLRDQRRPWRFAATDTRALTQPGALKPFRRRR